MGDELVDWVEIYEDAEGDWRWRGKSNNGRNVGGKSEEGFESRAYAEKVVNEMFPNITVKVKEERSLD